MMNYGLNGAESQRMSESWYIEFKKRCRWDSEHDREIGRIWNHKCAISMRSTLADIPWRKSSGRWMPEGVLKKFWNKWNTDPQFKEMSEQNKKNIASNIDGCFNHSSAISIPEQMRRVGVELKLGRDATVPEIFLKLNYNESIGEWKTPKAASAYVNGGKNMRGMLFGIGSEVAFYGSSSSKIKATQPTSDEVHELYNRLSIVEEENAYVKGELTSIRSLVEKMISTSCASSTRGCSCEPSAGDDGQNVNNEINNEDLGDDLEL